MIEIIKSKKYNKFQFYKIKINQKRTQNKMSSSNQNYFKRNHNKKGKRHSRKNKLGRETDDQIFNMLIGPTKSPVIVQEDEPAKYYSPKKNILLHTKDLIKPSHCKQQQDPNSKGKH